MPPTGFEPVLQDESLLSPLWSKLEELKARSVRAFPPAFTLLRGLGHVEFFMRTKK
jgi:hypothetical protein